MSSTWMVHLRFRIFGAYGPQWWVRRSRLPSRHFFESMILLYPLAGYFGALQCNIQPTMSMRLQFWDFCCVPKYRDRKLRLGQVIAFQHLLISAFLLATLVSSVFVFSDVKSQQNLRQDLWVFFGGSFYCLKSNIGDAFLGRQATVYKTQHAGRDRTLTCCW